MDVLLTPFQYDYMQKAILLSALIGAVCGLLSCFVTLKGWSLMGDALSHAVVPGVAIAYLIGAPFSVGAFIAGLLAAVGMGFVKANTAIKEDAIIGVVFSAFFALGIFLISINPAGVSLKTIVFGNILAISDSDVWQVILIAAGALLVIALKWKDFLLYCFDAQQARSLGFPVKALHYTLLTLMAAIAVAAMQAVGALLVVAMLITPGATAYLLTDRFGRMLLLAGGMGASTSFMGAYASYFLDGATGGCIVLLQTVCFLLALFFAPKHGMLAARAMRKRAQAGEVAS